MKAAAGIFLAIVTMFTGTAAAETTALGDVEVLAWHPAFDASAPHPGAAAISVGDVSGKKAPFSGFGGGGWSAQLDYIETIDRPDLIGTSVANGKTARPGFAVLQHSFGEGEFRPYLGVGIGAADTRFSDSGHLEKDGLAVMGVVGSNLQFTEMVGAFMQYEHAVATNTIVGAEGETKSHGVSFGVKIMLN